MASDQRFLAGCVGGDDAYCGARRGINDETPAHPSRAEQGLVDQIFVYCAMTFVLRRSR
jgi:hypothetical protein